MHSHFGVQCCFVIAISYFSYRGSKECIEQLIQHHKEDRLRATAVVLEALAAENKELDQDVEHLLGKYVMEAKARQTDRVHIVFLKAELEVWKSA